MDRQTLIKAMGNSVISDEEVAAFNEALVRAHCNTVNRVAMFCAQIGHESEGLRWYEEIASGAAYEWRNDLGNVNPGDGVRYKGRGPIQVTGRHNYGELSRWAHTNGYVPTPTYFVDRPEDLGTIRYGFLGAVWYWTVARNMNGFADSGDIRGASIAVNGGTNGLQDRINRWNRTLQMGEALLPTRETFMASLSDAEQREILEGARQLKPFGARKTAAEYDPEGQNWSAQALNRAALELSQRHASRSKYRDHDNAIDTIAGYILNIDARIHEESVERAARAGDSLAIAKIRKAADAGDAVSKLVIKEIEGK